MITRYRLAQACFERDRDSEAELALLPIRIKHAARQPVGFRRIPYDFSSKFRQAGNILRRVFKSDLGPAPQVERFVQAK